MRVKAEDKATDQLHSPLARMLLALPRGWTEPARESAIITSILMFAPVIEALHARDGLLSGRFVLDVQLFKDSYASCPVHLRPTLMASPPAQFLPPADFQRMFLPTYRQRLIRRYYRYRLVGTLEAFLTHHPEVAARYEDIILELFRNSSPSFCASGMRMAGAFLRNLAPAELKRLLIKLRSTDPLLRHNAMWALRAFMERPETIAPALVAFCTSAAVMRRVEEVANNDPDLTYRPTAESLLKTLRRQAGRRR